MGILRRRSAERLLLLLALASYGSGLATLALTGAGPAASRLALSAALFAGLVLALHLALTFFAAEADQFLLPLAVALSGLGLLEVTRLAPELAMQQLVWIGLGAMLLVAATFGLRDLGRLQRYKYTAALLGIGLMLVTAAVGREVQGARLWLQVGSIRFQPTELMKVLLVIFLAGYLAEKRELLAFVGRRVLGVRLPPLAYLAPLLLLFGLSLLITILQRDLGATLLLVGIAVVMLYASTGRVVYLVGGALLGLVNGLVGYLLFGYVRARVEVWLNPWADPLGQGYQAIQALLAIAAGGILGRGLGLGSPDLIPAVHTDFVFAAVAEELGLAGALALLGLYACLIVTALRLGLEARETFARLLAVGFATMLGIQTLIITGGTLRLIPLTGITLPFVSYGGSSLVMNFLVVGLLLRLSYQRAEQW